MSPKNGGRGLGGGVPLPNNAAGGTAGGNPAANAGFISSITEALDGWAHRVEGGVSHVAKAAGFVHFTIGFDAKTERRVVAPPHCIIAFPVRGTRGKHQSGLLTFRAILEDDIPRDPNVQGPVANHLRYKPKDERRLIPGADEYVEFELLSRAHEKPAQQPLRIAMGAARTNEESGSKEFVRIDLGQCITCVATDIIDDPKTGERLVQNRWWMCIETLRLLCTVNRVDCTAFDKPGCAPLEWVICLVDTRAPVNKKEQPREPPEKNINELMEFIDGDQPKQRASSSGSGQKKCQTQASSAEAVSATTGGTSSVAGPDHSTSASAVEAGPKPARARRKKGGKEKDSISAASGGGVAAGAASTATAHDTSAGDAAGDASPRVLSRSASAVKASKAEDVVEGRDSAGDGGNIEAEAEAAEPPLPCTNRLADELGQGDFLSCPPVAPSGEAMPLPRLSRETSQRSSLHSSAHEDPLDGDLMEELARKYQRLQESSRQLEDATKASTVRELLDVLDELEHACEEFQDDSKAWRRFSGIAQKFEARLRGLGMSRVETLGRNFDPRLHSLCLHSENSAAGGGPAAQAGSPTLDAAAGGGAVGERVIVEEIESGWTLGDTIVRPALVATT